MLGDTNRFQSMTGARPCRWIRLVGILATVALTTGWAAVAVPASPRPPIRLRVLRLVDHSRRAHFSDGTAGPRTLVTYIRVPSRGYAPFPLVVFAHGFALTPQTYTQLLNTWARAGYVVAAPVFPVENANAPGGPSRGDLGNEPGDISFVISRLTGSTSPVRNLIDPRRIAVAGQSDGAVAALSVAYGKRFRDHRLGAAIILSGAAPVAFTRPLGGTPPLLAVQGTSDPFNAPSNTTAYFRLIPQPKFLLWLLGATHLPPYTTNDRWAIVVDQASTAFLNHYLRGAPLRRLIASGSRTGIARITRNG